MKIQNTGIDLQRASLTSGVEKSAANAKKHTTEAPTAVSRGDSVQISDAGRALATQQAEGSGRPELSAERIGEIRERILTGAYNSVEVVEEVARRMLERGDI